MAISSAISGRPSFFTKGKIAALIGASAGGIHSRTDFDLKQHEKHSGKKLAYFDPELNKSYVPYVIETSIGLDRMFLAVLSASFNHEILDDQSKRIVLRIPPALAPIKAAILPLVKKDGLPEIAEEIAN